jgi:hypothetical protein
MRRRNGFIAALGTSGTLLLAVFALAAVGSGIFAFHGWPDALDINGDEPPVVTWDASSASSVVSDAVTGIAAQRPPRASGVPSTKVSTLHSASTAPGSVPAVRLPGSVPVHVVTVGSQGGSSPAAPSSPSSRPSRPARPSLTSTRDQVVARVSDTVNGLGDTVDNAGVGLGTAVTGVTRTLADVVGGHEQGVGAVVDQLGIVVARDVVMGLTGTLANVLRGASGQIGR